MTALASKRMDAAAYVADCLAKAAAASHYLPDMINNVLDISRLESGKLMLSEEAFDRSRLVKNLVTIVSTNAEKKRQHLILDAERIQNSRAFTAEETERLNARDADIEKFCRDSLIAFITGTRPLEEWDSYIKQLSLFRTDELLAIYQAALDRYTNSY